MWMGIGPDPVSLRDDRVKSRETSQYIYAGHIFLFHSISRQAWSQGWIKIKIMMYRVTILNEPPGDINPILSPSPPPLSKDYHRINVTGLVNCRPVLLYIWWITLCAQYQFWYLTKCSSQASRLTQFDIKYHFEEQKLIDTTYYTSGESHVYKVTAKQRFSKIKILETRAA